MNISKQLIIFNIIKDDDEQSTIYLYPNKHFTIQEDKIDIGQLQSIEKQKLIYIYKYRKQ